MLPAPARLSGISGALLHFKFLSDFHAKAESEAARGRIFRSISMDQFVIGGCDQLVSLNLCQTI
jgi:hypothetical protein